MKLRQLITRKRARKTTKWVGLVLCVLLAAVFVSSRWVHVAAVVWPTRSVCVVVGISEGRFQLTVDRYTQRLPARRAGARYAGLLENPGLKLWLDLDRWNMGGGIMYSFLGLPLWMPLLLLAAPTVWLWRVDRRAEPWQCAKCRYDLRGLEGGGDGGGDKIMCPECGSAKGEA